MCACSVLVDFNDTGNFTKQLVVLGICPLHLSVVRGTILAVSKPQGVTAGDRISKAFPTSSLRAPIQPSTPYSSLIRPLFSAHSI